MPANGFLLPPSKPQKKTAHGMNTSHALSNSWISTVFSITSIPRMTRRFFSKSVRLRTKKNKRLGIDHSPRGQRAKTIRAITKWGFIYLIDLPSCQEMAKIYLSPNTAPHPACSSRKSKWSSRLIQYRHTTHVYGARVTSISLRWDVITWATTWVTWVNPIVNKLLRLLAKNRILRKTDATKSASGWTCRWYTSYPWAIDSLLQRMHRQWTTRETFWLEERVASRPHSSQKSTANKVRLFAEPRARESSKRQRSTLTLHMN